MKKLLIIPATALIFTCCGGSAEKANDNNSTMQDSAAVEQVDEPQISVAEQLDELANKLLDPALTVDNGLLDYFTPELQQDSKKPLNLELLENGWSKFKSLSTPIIPGDTYVGGLKLVATDPEALTATYGAIVQGEFVDEPPYQGSVIVQFTTTDDGKLLVKKMTFFQDGSGPMDMVNLRATN